MHYKLVPIAMCTIVCWSSPALGSDGWIGHDVMTKAPDVSFYSISMGRKLVCAPSGFCYRVVHETDGWLEVRGDGDVAWVRTDDVIRLKDAATLYSDIIRANSNDPWAWRMRAHARYNNGEYAEAIADFDKTLSLNPRVAEDYFFRGWIRGQSKDYEKAVADFDEAIKLDPKLAKAFNYRGFVWKLKKDYEKALADFDEAIRIDAKYSQAYCNRGYVWWHKNEVQKADQDWESAIAIDPQNQVALVARGNACLYRNQHKKAIGYYDRALKEKCDQLVLVNRGVAWNALHEFDKAILDFDEAIRVGPKQVAQYHGRGVSWFWKGEYSNAIEDFTEAVKRGSKDRYVFYWRGCSFLAKGEYGPAISDFQQFIDSQACVKVDRVHAQ